jgi:uncharacterized protein YaiI (UPF0178 family)
MTIWVDADAMPREVRDILIRAAQRRKVDVVMVANRPIHNAGSQRVSSIQVAQGADVADDYIAEHCTSDDLVVTADIPLAARVVEKGGLVLQPRGRVLDKENVEEVLSIRDFKEELRSGGVITGGPPPFDAGAKQRFANALDRWITARANR